MFEKKSISQKGAQGELTKTSSPLVAIFKVGTSLFLIFLLEFFNFFAFFRSSLHDFLPSEYRKEQ